MPIEIIGDFGTPGASREWLSAQAAVAIRNIIKTCGAPEMYIERCEEVLTDYENR